VQRKIKHVTAKRIKLKRQFVKLFKQNNFVTLLHVYDAYRKTKNILHIHGADGNKKKSAACGI
jgi:hypothetical protein